MTTHELFVELTNRYPHQPTFLQAAEEFLTSISSYLEEINATDTDYQLVRRMLVPERVISFRVDWVDDAGVMQTNTGYRVQFNSILGPYKGGLRFDPTVNEDVLKFLGFEQIFKNALTGLRLGGGKGGSDFSSKEKSDNEIRSFCRAFMLALYQHIGIERDVPAGDIGVGGREIGYMYGMYKQITNTNEGVLTGKDELFGGSCRRTEATGHGVVYLAEAMVDHHGLSLDGMTAVVSGSGNVAEFTARKLIELGTKVLTLSDRSGYVHKVDGFTQDDISNLIAAKQQGKNLVDIQITGTEFSTGTPWGVKADAYFPCATQNELTLADAERIVSHAKLIVEGANMPLTSDAQQLVRAKNILYAPGKAANAGGVSVSGMEMAQNAAHYAWTSEEVETELKRIMRHIHSECVRYGKKADGNIDYVSGANIAGFKKVFAAAKKLGL